MKKKMMTAALLAFCLLALAGCSRKAARNNEEGLSAIQEGNYTQAAACFRAAVEADPKEAVYVKNLAAAYMYAGQWEKALSTWGALKPEETDEKDTALMAEAWWQLGLSAASSGDRTEAEECLAAARSMAPEKASSVCRVLGDLKAADGDWEGAFAAYEEGLSLTDKPEKELYRGAALCCEHMGEFTRALDILLSCEEEAGTDEEIRREIAFLRTRVHD